MSSTIDKVHVRLQEAMEQGNQASLGQAIDASKGVNGLKQLRRSAKARLKQLSADQNRSMIGSHIPPEEPLTWRTSEQSGRYRAVAHLPTSIIGWVIGHKGCNARMLKQQTGTELWVDVPGQCVIIEARAVHEVEGAMEAVNGFVKTAPTFIAKVQAGAGGGITQTVQCPVHLLPSIQRLSRKIQAESGANCVFANCKMSTFCITGERKNVDRAVAMITRLIAEGNAEVMGNAGGVVGGERRGPSMLLRNAMGGLGTEFPHRLGRVGSDMSRSEGSPATAPCSPATDMTTTANLRGTGEYMHADMSSWRTRSAPGTLAMMDASTSPNTTPPLPSTPLTRFPGSCPFSTPPTPGGPAPFQGGIGIAASGVMGNGSSDHSFFSFGGPQGTSSASGTGGAPNIQRAHTVPCGSSGSGSGLGPFTPNLPGLGALEESSAGAGNRLNGSDQDLDDEGRPSSCGSGEFGGSEALAFPAQTRRPGSVGSAGVGSGSGGGGAGVGGGGGGSGAPLEGNIEDLLEELGLSKYLEVFQNSEVDLATLCIMSEQDFRELGILKGPRVKIMHHIGSR